MHASLSPISLIEPYVLEHMRYGKSTLIYEFCVAVRTKIGPFATPDIIQNAPGLPKTRSGKIMRRVLRHVAKNDKNVGDITTMADSSVVDTLFENRPHVNFLPD